MVEFAELESFQISTLGTVDASGILGTGASRCRTPDSCIGVLVEGHDKAEGLFIYGLILLTGEIVRVLF